MVTHDEIKGWFQQGVKARHTHMVVVCDTYDHSDYPVYASSPEDCLTQYRNHHGRNMQRVMEVYDLSKPWRDGLYGAQVMELPEPSDAVARTSE